MSRHWNWLAIGLLAIGLVGCGGGEKDAADGKGGGDPATAKGDQTSTPDGPKVDAGPGPKVSAGSGPKVVVPAKPVAGAPEWMKYVGPQHISATVVHPKRILQSKVIAALPKGLDLGETRKNVGFDIRHTERLLILGHPPTEKQMVNLRENLGWGGGKKETFRDEAESGGPAKADDEFDEQEFEKGAFDDPAPPSRGGRGSGDAAREEEERQRAAEPPGIGDATFVVWLDQPADREEYVAVRAAAHREEPRTIDVDGHEATQVGNREAILFLDDTTILVGPVPSLRELLAAKQAAGPLAARLAEAGTDYDALVVVNLAGRAEMLQLLHEALKADGIEVPENLADLPAAAEKITEIVGRVDVSAEGTLATLHVTAADSDAAAVLADSAGKGLDLGKGLLAFIGFSAPPEAREGLQLATATLNGVKIEQQGNTAVVTVPRPDGLVAFVESIAPRILAAQEAAKLAVFRGHLKQVGLAIHNYHEIYQHAPAAAAYTTEDGTPLLSWRVMLLPMLESSALNAAMDRTKAWDDETNKQFLNQMPTVFKSPGVDDPTRTTLMVFTGDTTPFDGMGALVDAGGNPSKYRRGPRIANITDGTSNTILAVYAAPEKAVPWTKPQDLVFDPQKPLESIGEIPETGLLVLMWDGAVRILPKDVAADLFKNLVEHQDGNPVEIP